MNNIKENKIIKSLYSYFSKYFLQNKKIKRFYKLYYRTFKLYNSISDFIFSKRWY